MSDIAELMRTDPLKLTRVDVEAIVKEMRNARHLFNAGPAPKAAKVSKAEAAGVSVDLTDLGL